MRKLLMSAFMILVLSGCDDMLNGMFEPQIYGVKESTWHTLSEVEKERAKTRYYQNQLEENQRAQREAEYQRQHQQYQDLQNQLDAQRRERAERAARQEREYQQRRQQNYQPTYPTYSAPAPRSYTAPSPSNLSSGQQERLRRMEQEASERQRRAQQEASDRAYAESLAREGNQSLEEAVQTQRSIEESFRQSSQPAPASAPSAPQPSSWEPNSGHLVQAGDLLMQQRTALGRVPTHDEQVQYLSQHMNITSPQANVILNELGM